MIKKILIDLDQTILNHNRGIKHALNFLYSKCKNNHKYQWFIQRYNHCNHELWSMYEKGIIDVSTLIEIRNRFVLREFGISRYELHRFNKIYAKECKIFPVWLKIFPYLKRKNIEIYIFSNGLRKIQLKKIKSAKIMDVFSGFFFRRKTTIEQT
ncbi:TPA: HAD family hydrolase [Mannheimia haemolytica]